MLYTVCTDENMYVLSISHTKYDDVEIDIKTLEEKYLNAYILVEKSLILDSEKKKSMIDEEQKEAKETEIIMLKKQLSDTDYIIAETFENVMNLDNPITFISDIIKILVQFKTKYKDVLDQRKVWRDRIEELSK